MLEQQLTLVRPLASLEQDMYMKEHNTETEKILEKKNIHVGSKKSIYDRKAK